MINIGTIVELYKSEVLVMTLDFELVRVKRKPEMYLGEQVSFKKSDVIRLGNKITSFVFLAGIAAILMFAFIAVYTIQNKDLNHENTSYAFIDIDINPSIELLVDTSDTVQKVLPLNSDAENLMNTIQIKDLPVKEAVQKVIERSRETGILNSNKSNAIMISASLNPENSDYKVKREYVELKLNQLLNSLKTLNTAGFNKKYSIKVVKVEPEIKKLAIENGLSAGRQFILKKAQIDGVDLTLDEAKSESLPVLMKKVGMDELNEGSSGKQNDRQVKGQDMDKEPLNSPVIQSTGKIPAAATPTPEILMAMVHQTPEKVSALIKPTSEKATAVPPKESKPTPLPVSGNIQPIEVKKPQLSSDSIKIQYYNPYKEGDSVIQIAAVLNVVNTGNTVIDLKDVTIRYYYTIDGDKSQSLDCWAQIDKPNIIYKFVKMSKPVEKADYYLEIGFKSGQLNPGENTKVVPWFNKDDWAVYKVEDDYSHHLYTNSELYDWKYVTGYISGVLKWGIEPE